MAVIAAKIFQLLTVPKKVTLFRKQFSYPKTYIISNTTSFRAIQCLAIAEVKCLFFCPNCFIVFNCKLLSFRKTVNQATFLPSLFKHVATFIWNFLRKSSTFDKWNVLTDELLTYLASSRNFLKLNEKMKTA